MDGSSFDQLAVADAGVVDWKPLGYQYLEALIHQ
jgi:hypothetical protein